MLCFRKDTTDTYYYRVPHGGETTKEVKIIFENSEFKSAHFDVKGKALYSRLDWELLGRIAEEISNLEAEYHDA